MIFKVIGGLGGIISITGIILAGTAFFQPEPEPTPPPPDGAPPDGAPPAAPPAAPISFIGDDNTGSIDIDENLFTTEYTVMVGTTDERVYKHTAKQPDGRVYAYSSMNDKTVFYLNENNDLMFHVKTFETSEQGYEPNQTVNLTEAGIPRNELNYWTWLLSLD